MQGLKPRKTMLLSRKFWKADKGELQKKPYTLKGSQLAPLQSSSTNSRNERIVNYSEFIRSVLDPSSVVALIWLRIIISAWPNTKRCFVFLGSSLLIIAVAISTLVASFFLRKRTIASYEELYQAYPELQGDISHVADQASYYNQELKSNLIQKSFNHLFQGDSGSRPPRCPTTLLDHHSHSSISDFPSNLPTLLYP